MADGVYLFNILTSKFSVYLFYQEMHVKISYCGFVLLPYSSISSFPSFRSFSHMPVLNSTQVKTRVFTKVKILHMSGLFLLSALSGTLPCDLKPLQSSWLPARSPPLRDCSQEIVQAVPGEVTASYLPHMFLICQRSLFHYLISSVLNTKFSYILWESLPSHLKFFFSISGGRVNYSLESHLHQK